MSNLFEILAFIVPPPPPTPSFSVERALEFLLVVWDWDGSWDRKWEDSQRNETEVRSRPWARPGKLNNSYWENRVKTEHGLPPKTPPPRRKLMDVGVGYNNDMR